MSASPELADHIAELLAPLGGISRRRMFGGMAFRSHGEMVAILSRSNELYLKSATPLDGLGRQLESAAAPTKPAAKNAKSACLITACPTAYWTTVPHCASGCAAHRQPRRSDS